MKANPTAMSELDAFPAPLRALLDAEFAAGNELEEIGHSHPAPPAGAYARLKCRVSTRLENAADGLSYRRTKSSLSAGYYSDAQRFYFIVEPPLTEDGAYPDMDAIREAASHRRLPVPETSPAQPTSPPPLQAQPAEPIGARERFQKSMVMDYDKWHGGIGYDLVALNEMTAAERKDVEQQLISRGVNDWRDVEALHALDTPRARKTLRAALQHRSPEIRMAVQRVIPELVSATQRTGSLIAALKTADFFGGLSQALDEAAEFHPPEVIEALLHGALDRMGDGPVHFAALLFYIHGKADAPFDMTQRPFFLRFATDERAERVAAFRELCDRLKIDATRYLSARD